MDAALVELTAIAPKQRLDADRIRDILLLRLAVAGKALPRDAIAKELGAITTHLIAPEIWQAQLDRDLAALADAGLADVKASSAAATDAGLKRAAIMLGGRGVFPKTWTDARDVRLMARALGLENESPAKLKRLSKPDGLRVAILVKSFGLKLRGTPSPVKVRSALAKVALSRAFGNSVEAAAGGRTGLSAKAGRALAGRLASTPQDFRTDSRLIAALAADQVHASGLDFSSLQLALLRRFVTKGEVPAALIQRKARRGKVKAKLRLVPPPPVAVQAAVVPVVPVAEVALAVSNDRPSLTAFVADVLALATPVAEGFMGNRKAFISRVWSTVSVQRSRWGLTEIEFKCMLAEAHRVGALVLANADLKDGRHLADIQASALSYKNAVFHYVRIDT
jgi:hypothetical protein